MSVRLVFAPVAVVLAGILVGIMNLIMLPAEPSWAQSTTPISFGKSLLKNASSVNPTSLQFGPDGRLYVAQQDGTIKAYTIQRTGANAYSVTNTETINLVASMPNRNDDGSLNPSVTGRQVTGILVAGTQSQPEIYVGSSDPRIGAGGSGTDLNLDTNSGIISRLDWDGSKWVKTDLVRGLPRSEENHSVNGMQLSADGQTLYVAAGGNTNQGAPSNNFALLPEYALSAAILKIDLAAIGNNTYDVPTLDDEDRPGSPDANDPFGGNDGKNQAKIVPGGPVQVYAPGFRNPYDLVIAKSGKMYTVDNGGNAGWGDIPVGEGPGGTCTNQPNEPGQTNQDDFHLIDGQGYYGGHPNPTRGNQANKFNSTNPQSPVAQANPVECDWNKPAAGTLTTFPASTNGLDEYTASNFGGAMQGDLLTAGHDNNIYRIQLDDNSGAITQKGVLFNAVGQLPLDVTAQGDNDPFPGTVWAADIYGSSIVVFEPAAATSCDASNPSGDPDGDGYTNSDEQANGTDPCSAADVPPDWDKDKISDKTDPDDDNDGNPDTSDPFALDPNNGTTTSLPLRYDFSSVDQEGGLLNLGFTGLMTNGTTDYQNLYDPNNLTAGGAAGVLSVDQVSEGDALLGFNNQENAYQSGFQTGIDVSTGSGVFTARTRVASPFAGITPQDYQSMGLFLGTGDQDNYVKLVTSSNGGKGGIEFAKEVGGQFTGSPQPTVAMPGPDWVDLYLTVDAVAKTVQPSYVVSTNGTPGPLTKLGDPVPIPEGWVDSSKAMAVGLISTSFGGAPPFPATWDFIEVVRGAPDTTPGAPTVSGVAPQGGGVAVGANVEATFSEAMDASSIHNVTGASTTFTLTKQGTTTPVGASVSYDATTKKAILNPSADLEANTTYTATVKGGTSGVKDLAGNPLASDKSWSFSTAVTPGDGQWQTLAPSSTNRQEVSYVQSEGKFYLAGGSTLHERYDPKTNSWGQLAPLPANLDHIQGVELGGKIYYIGGLLGWPSPQSSAVYVYDPKTNTFSEGAPMPADRARGAGGIATYNGKIYVAGGLHDGVAVPWFDVYDPVTKTWTQLPNMPRAKDHFHAAVVDGKFYAIGGRNTAIDATIDKVDVYDLASGAGGTWQTPNTALPTPRGGFAAAVLGKEILIIGGEGGGTTYNTVEAYNTTTNSWRQLKAMPTARHGIQAAECNGGVYIAAGGKTQGGGNPTNVHEAFFLNGPTSCDAPSDTTAPTVSSMAPQGAEVAVGAKVEATFSEAMDASTISGSTFTLKQGATTVPAAVTYDAGTKTATLTPSSNLLNNTTYTATLKGGTSGVKDLAGNALASDKTWSFSTGASTTTNGLKGEYYDNQDLTNLKLTRTDPKVDFSWGSGSPDPSIAPDTFSVRWSGQVKADHTETYTFYTSTNDGVRLWVNGQQIINRWSDGLATNTGTISLQAGQWYPITMEYYEGINTASAKLEYSSASTPRQVVPTDHLRPEAPSDTTAPTVSSMAPQGAEVAVGAKVEATFSEAMDASTISGSTFTLKQGATTVPAAVTYDAGTKTATLTPSSNLLNNTTYTATLKGGTSGVKDLAGNPLASDKTWSFTTAAGTTPPPPDTTPPQTTIDSGPSGNAKSREATFTFSSSEAGSSFECSLDSGAFSACSSPKTYTGLANGSHTFSVRAKDAAGNIDPTPASRTWKVRL